MGIQRVVGFALLVSLVAVLTPPTVSMHAAAMPVYDTALDVSGRSLAASLGPAFPTAGIWVNSPSRMPDWQAEPDQAIAAFGYSAATAGDVNGDGYDDVIVGAPWYDQNGSGSGAVFVYHGSASGLSSSADWQAYGPHEGADLGRSAATAGDVNGDGYDDVIVGAPGYTNGQDAEGGIFVWLGGSSGLGATGTVDNADWKAEINQEGANLGRSVAAAGDVDGDGKDDVIAGAPRYDWAAENEGIALVYHGTATGLSTTWDWIASSGTADADLGCSVGTAGDVNGDGYDDVIVGAREYSSGSDYEGAAFVWLGSSAGLGPSGTPVNADWSAESDREGGQFGYSVGRAGDVNGDGYDDIVIASPELFGYDGGAYVYHGSATGPDANGTRPRGTLANADWSVEVGQCNLYGYAAGTAGDVNGDAFDDLIVGEPCYEGKEGGRAYVYHGSSTGLSAAEDWTSVRDSALGSYAMSAGSAGNVNGDGYDDLIVGLPFTDRNQQELAGMAFVYHGAAEAPVYWLNIRAYIDGTSQLVISGDTVYWHHVAHAAPGRLEGASEPTYLDGWPWYPTWPDVPTPENRNCDCPSSALQGVPPVPEQGVPARLNVVEARDRAQIVQQPSAGNNYTLIVEFDDGPGGGAWYEIQIAYTGWWLFLPLVAR